jgi:hypothetical protein
MGFVFKAKDRMEVVQMKRTIVPAAMAAIALLVVSWASSPVFAQSARLQLANLEKLTSKAAEVVDVTLDGTLLKMASRFLSAGDESEVKDLVQGLQGIYVRSFEFDKEGEYSAQDVEAIRSQLHAPGWSRIVGVTSKRDGENAEVFIMTDSATGKVLGMGILCAEPKELTIVNIVGAIDIDKIADLEGKMGIPHMNLEKKKTSLKKPEEDHEKP